jgi:DNA polymerase elongation subunit (family B)
MGEPALKTKMKALMSNSVPKEMRQYVNAYLDEGGKYVVRLYRDRAGELRQERVRAEYVMYVRDGELTPQLERALKRSTRTLSVTRERTEGAPTWVRIALADDQARKAYVRDKKSPFKEAGIEIFEGDVDPIRRWLTDEKVIIAKPRRVYLDIEWDSRCNFYQAKEEGLARVLCWSLVNDDEKVVACGVLEEDSDYCEKMLLEELFAALGEWDQVCAWSGDDADFPVIMKRAEKVEVARVDARRWLLLDHLKAFERMNKHSAETGEEKQSMKLENIAQAVVHEGKTFEQGLDPKKTLGAQTWEMWEAGGKWRQLLVRYMIRDTKLLAKIERKKGYLTLFQTVCEACTLFGSSDSLNPTRQMDGFLLRLARERGHHFATKKFYEKSETEEQFEGAYVLHPRTLADPDEGWTEDDARKWRLMHGFENGVLTNVHVCDFSALYPSIIQTLNMSADTKVANDVVPEVGPVPEGFCRSPATGVAFSLAKRGLLPIALDELIRLRKHWNDLKASLPPGTEAWIIADNKSTAYKVVANSFYGVVGSPFSRYFDRDIAEGVTQTGVWLIRKVIAEAQKRGFTTLYGDTDSCFVIGATEAEFRDFVKWCNEVLFPPMLARQGCTKSYVKLAFEKTFKRLVMTAAKRYIGSYAQYKGKPAEADSKPEVKGLEYKRGDASLAARTLQGQVIDLLVGNLGLNPGVECPTDDLTHYHSVLAKARDHVLKDELTFDEVKIAKSISKPLREYVTKEKKNGDPGTDIAHVRVAKILEQRGEQVSKGTKIEYIVTDASVSPAVVMPASDYTGVECDRYYLWDTQIFPTVQRLLEAAYPDHDWSSWGKVRPPKVRKPRAPKPKRVAPGQLAMPEKTKTISHRFELRPDASLAVPAQARRTAVYTLRLDEASLPNGVDDLDVVKAILAKHPGTRPVTIIIRLKTGEEAVLGTPLTVSGSLALHTALAPYRGPVLSNSAA